MHATVPLPTSDVELFAEDVLHDPYLALRDIREAGPCGTADRLTTPGSFPATSTSAAALSDHARFSSAHGVGYEDQFNARMEGTVLVSDPPDQARLRAPLSDKLTSKALAGLRTRIAALADALATDAAAKGDFDAVTDLAAVLPVTVVADLVGLGEEARGPLLSFANAAFNTFGPLSARAPASIPFVNWMFGDLSTVMAPENLRPDGWVAAIHQAAERGKNRGRLRGAPAVRVRDRKHGHRHQRERQHDPLVRPAPADLPGSTRRTGARRPDVRRKTRQHL
ncbi:cytochrome P450 [Streptomyces sp. SAI-126]|uniref:hypothetical protein n=1 Tax=Streptomyces sp. SAI-126 TaxID=3377732 RepID=UPI000FB59C81